MARAIRDLSEDEESQIRAQHNSDNQYHGKAGCKVCRLISMLDTERARRAALEEALKDALREGVPA